MLNMTCANSSVRNPLEMFSVTNKPRSEAPNTISGAAMLRNMTCSNATFPRKR